MLESLGKPINLKDLSLTTPIDIHQKKFHPEISITENDWERMFKHLSVLEGEEQWLSWGIQTAAMKLISLKKSASIQLPSNYCKKVLVSYGTEFILDDYNGIDLYTAKIVSPQQFNPQLYKEELYSIVNFISQEFDRIANNNRTQQIPIRLNPISQAIRNLFVCDPHFFDFWENEWKTLKKFLVHQEEADDFIESAANLKLANPNLLQGLNIDKHIWEKGLLILNDLRSPSLTSIKDSHWWDFAIHGANLSILSASEIMRNEDGIHLIHKELPSFQSEEPPLPIRRKF